MSRDRAGADRLGTAHAIVRFGMGAVSLGADALVERVRRADAGDAAPTPDVEDGASISVGDVGAGLALAMVSAAGRAWSEADRRRGRLAAWAQPLGRAPVLRPLTRPVRRAYARGESTLHGLSRRGRAEVMAGRRMVQLAARDVAAQTFNVVAEVALDQVTHSPEVAELVRTQTAGVATETIVEVRENSRRADEGVERRIRSWLRLDGGQVDRTPRRAS